LTKLLDDFTAKVPQSSFGNPSAINFPEATTYLQKYQDPRQADAIIAQMMVTELMASQWLQLG